MSHKYSVDMDPDRLLLLFVVVVLFEDDDDEQLNERSLDLLLPFMFDDLGCLLVDLDCEISPCIFFRQLVDK